MTMTDSGPAARFYTDQQIAIAVYWQACGLLQAQGEAVPEPWETLTDHERALWVAMVVAARRGCTADDLYRMQSGGESTWAEQTREQRLRWVCFVLLVGAMAGEERR